ncbi:Hypothetical_protein [Hexamita inflata]|uniref:Hypothetical_protein n=1 Tax=Hexamita inflata TaxID=28002 RepID=A0AA86UQ87_9EUKA|nr:Hypothetical protein HINF_LOCUS47851 [Hexamita inflata]
MKVVGSFYEPANGVDQLDSNCIIIKSDGLPRQNIFQFKRTLNSTDQTATALIFWYNNQIQRPILKYLPVAQQYAQQYGPNGPSGYSPFLCIDSDQELRDLRFVSELGVTDLRLNSCQNAHALRAPANLRAFYHFSSALKTAKGVERLVGLELEVIKQGI